MEKRYKVYKKIGKLKKSILDMLEREVRREIYIDEKIFSHIKRRHGKQLTKKIKNNMLWTIEEIIESPDYISIESEEYNFTIKLVKKFEIDLVIVVQLDSEEEYLYVATMYPLRSPRVKEKIVRGTLKTLVDKNA